MTLRARVCILVISTLVLVVAVPFGVRRYRIAKSAAFCDAVESLPRSELEQFATRCEHLIAERGGRDASLQFIVDADTLGQFALAGRKPYEIVLEKGTVGIKYIKGHWSYSTLALSDEDQTASGESVRVLKITYGTFGWRILCQRYGQKDEKVKHDG